jgi:phosphoribosylamine--glycine ligase
MRFAVCSVEGLSVGLARRLQDEGNEVMLWTQQFSHRGNGKGLIPTTGSFEAICAWGMARKNSVFIFDCTNMGDKADFLRKRGHFVFGGGSFMDKLENERSFGESIAKRNGILVPETVEHTTLSQSIKWLSTHDDGRGWYFKPNKDLGTDTTQGKDTVEGLVRYLEFMQRKFGDRISHILQEKLDGVDISTACYWNGKSFVGPFEGTVEHKKFMNEDIGPSTGCSFNIVWFYQNDYPKIVQQLHWREIESEFRRNQAPPGVYDINALISKVDGKARFLEWTPRFGYDAEPTAWKALTKPIGEVFYDLSAGRLAEVPFDIKTNAMSVRLSVSPYPFHSTDDMPVKHGCVDTPVWGADGLWQGLFYPYSIGIGDEGDLVMSDASGLVGMAHTLGTNLEEMNDSLLDFIKEDLEITGLQYRTDAAECLGKHVDELRDLGYEIPLVETPEEG